MTDPEHIAVLDAALARYCAGHQAERSWRILKAKLARASRISSTSLPAVGNAAQHFVAARTELDAGINALGEGFVAGAGEEPEEDR